MYLLNKKVINLPVLLQTSLGALQSLSSYSEILYIFYQIRHSHTQTTFLNKSQIVWTIIEHTVDSQILVHDFSVFLLFTVFVFSPYPRNFEFFNNILN